MTIEDSDLVERPEWVTDDIDLNRPNAARMYDCLLGGYHNFEIDRQIVRQTLELFPDAALHAKISRRILSRSVRLLSEQGIDQFLDIGAGIPTAGSTHEVAHQMNANAHVVYVDNDPIVAAHGKMILRNVPNTVMVKGDIRQSRSILEHESVIRLIDFDRPVGLLLVLLLHYLPDDAEAYASVEQFKTKLVSGSYMLISHSTYEEAPVEIMKRFEKITGGTSTPHKNRSKKEIAQFFTGFELQEPGIVHLPLWRPESPNDPLLDEPGQSMSYAGLGRKL